MAAPGSIILLVLSLALLGAASPARIVNGVASSLMKLASSLKTTTKTSIAGRPMMKFESGYNVETVFDGSKLGIVPHALELLPNGKLLLLDSANSNLYTISSSLSLYNRPKLIVGSADGYSGHVDGKLREAKMNHPKSLTVDDKGNIYVADAANMAIRKIADTGVTTIAGGSKGGRSEEARFSNDFDVLYIGSSCSLLVIDRGNQAIREIQLPFEDCAYHYAAGFPLGIAVLVAAGFFGYMLALLQHRFGSIVSSQMDGAPTPAYQKSTLEKQEEGFLGKLMANSSFFFRKKQKQEEEWPVQDSYVIADGDEAPPSTPTPKKTYPFMTSDASEQFRHIYSGWEQHHNRYYSSMPATYYEQSTEKTNEIIFGAVQLQQQGGSTVLDHHHRGKSRIRSRGD